MTLHVRAATPGDAAAVDTLLDAYALVRVGRPQPPGAALARLTQPGSVPALVHDDTGAVLGFGHAWRAGPAVRCFARVHPDATGRGVGTALLAELEDRAGTTLGCDVVTVMQPGTDTAGTALLLGRGYTEIHRILRMRRSLHGYDRPAASLPPGVAVTGFDEARDAGELFAAFRAAFPADPADEAAWWRDRRANPAEPFDPALWFVARHGDRIVGFCHGGRHGDRDTTVGYVGDVGVVPGWRGRGIAFALLTTALAAFAVDGLPTGVLNVDADNATGALELYRKAGMTAEPWSTEWSRTLR
ncbi:hypothetical protein Lfu02_60640 [Longispora fulva]|uniref:Mycothiol synthase n=1 Tax=Longispora fulva TaxID=619741 RepID=A0A8J7GHD4_9ACTN|nr:GNAT family N-acetyltransferase [Longispora fulva]MBG6136955.1 mycothiol synthase [Longispora fulva]GIG61692.1 hypothetical protein Lfu02_60640 [Longispora fulva]